MIDFVKNNRVSLSIFVAWLFAVSGVMGLAVGFKDWFIPKTPLNLIVIALLLIVNYPIVRLKTYLAFFIAFFVGMLVEIAGVQTGVIFGEYYYGGNMGPKILDVPYMIGVNWAVMSFVSAAISARFLNSKALVMVVGALLMVAFDLVLEQAASVLDYWHWAGDVIPLRNYIAWFVVSLGLQWMIHKLAPPEEFKYSLNLYVSQLIFLLFCTVWLT